MGWNWFNWGGQTPGQNQGNGNNNQGGSIYAAPTAAPTATPGEGGFGSSGSKVIVTPTPTPAATPTPVPPSTPGAEAKLTWTNQNGGSHSDLSLEVKTPSKLTSCNQCGQGSRMTITIQFTGKGSIKSLCCNASSYTLSGNTITIVYNGCYNANENKQFSVNNIVFEDGMDGNGSYWPSGSHMSCDASDAFIISSVTLE